MRESLYARMKSRLTRRNIVLLLIFLVSIALLTISSVSIIGWIIDSNEIEAQATEAQDVANVTEIEDTDDTETFGQDGASEDNPYWKYVKMNLINVDFGELKKINSNTKGWIQVGGTNINYPFVQAANNEYYLTHSYNQSWNSAGWVFLDYRNEIKDLAKNTILYAHGRLDATMFGSLKDILKSGWLQNSDNYVVRLSTEAENTLWQVFSAYRIPTTDDYIRVNFRNDDDFTLWASNLVSRSVHDFKTGISGSDKILTLSTCYNNSEKVVLHAKLIKRSPRA